MQTSLAMQLHHKIVVVGGGSGGLTVAARLCRALKEPDLAIIEPSDRHFYQPLWTLVGGGAATRASTVRAEADLIPRGATWIRDAVREFLPEQNLVTTEQGRQIHYDYLVVAPGSSSTGPRSTGSRPRSAATACAATTASIPSRARGSFSAA
jgi:sulfide:quinone oxidoreductase